MTRDFEKLKCYIGFLQDLSKLSCCRRAQQSALIIAADYSAVHALGYNGPPMGSANNSCRNDEGSCGCVHAEANAVARLDAMRIRNSIMLCTTSPCELCAGLIVNCQAIRLVVYLHEYRLPRGLEVLACGGVTSRRYSSADDLLTLIRRLRC